MKFVTEEEIAFSLSISCKAAREFCERNHVPPVGERKKGPGYRGVFYSRTRFIKAFKKNGALICRKEVHHLCRLALLQAEAQRQAREARKSGKIIPEPCEVCGTTFWVVAHHEDYSRPLYVRWLCNTHHLRYHGHLRHGKVRDLESITVWGRSPNIAETFANSTEVAEAWYPNRNHQPEGAKPKSV